MMGFCIRERSFNPCIRSSFLVLSLIALIVVTLLFKLRHTIHLTSGMFTSSALTSSQSVISFPKEFFEGFPNDTGADSFIVPNIIHFIRFNITQYNFVEYVCLRAAFRNHRPDQFYIHTDVPGLEFTGKYWSWIQRDTELYSRIRLMPLEAPTEIFGQKLNEDWRFSHGSDLARIQVLMKYGGIYLDNDVYIIRSLNKYRKFEMVLNWDERQFLGTQLYVAHKDARFLPLYLETYKDHYHEDAWYYNAGERPTQEILYHHPELIHRVKRKFGADVDLSTNLYIDTEFDWRSFEAFHLLANHRYYLDPHYEEIPIFNETNILSYPYPFGEMAREML